MLSSIINYPAPAAGQGLPAPSHQPPGHDKTELDLPDAASRLLLALDILDLLAQLAAGSGPLARMVAARVAEVEALTIETGHLLLWPSVPTGRPALVAALAALAEGVEVAS